MNIYYSYAYQRCTHSTKGVNEYIAEYFRLVERNQLPKSKNQPKALQELSNYCHDPSSLIGECKEI